MVRGCSRRVPLGRGACAAEHVPANTALALTVRCRSELRRFRWWRATGLRSGGPPSGSWQVFARAVHASGRGELEVDRAPRHHVAGLDGHRELGAFDVDDAQAGRGCGLASAPCGLRLAASRASSFASLAPRPATGARRSPPGALASAGRSIGPPRRRVAGPVHGSKPRGGSPPGGRRGRPEQGVRRGGGLATTSSRAFAETNPEPLRGRRADPADGVALRGGDPVVPPLTLGRDEVRGGAVRRRLVGAAFAPVDRLTTWRARSHLAAPGPVCLPSAHNKCGCADAANTLPLRG